MYEEKGLSTNLRAFSGSCKFSLSMFKQKLIKPSQLNSS